MAQADTRYSIDFDATHQTDVLVVGGGPAGCLAALSARRNGADVTLLERESYLGGSMTGMMVNTLNAFRSTSEDRSLVVEGISLEVFQNLLEEKGTHSAPDAPVPVELDHGQFTDPSLMVHVLDEMMMDANVDVIYNTFAFDAIVEEGAVEGVVLANKSGGQVILADQIVDCSGDADIAAAAGAPFEFGREEDGRFHGGSMLMQVGGIDLDGLLAYLKRDPDMTRADLEQLQTDQANLLGAGGPPGEVQTPDGGTISRGIYQPRDWEMIEADREQGKPLNFRIRAGPTGMGVRYDYDEYGGVPPELKYNKAWIDFIKEGRVPPMLGTPKHIYPPPPSIGILGFGMFKHGKPRYDMMLTGIYEAWFDQTDAESISDAIMYMRKVNKTYMEFFRERVGGFEDAYIVSESPSVGKRESRRIVGGYVLDEGDQSVGRKFSDVIAKSGRPPSAHSVTGEWGTFVAGQVEEAYDIPYRCLLPKEVEDLLVAGRTISVTFGAFSGIRDQGTCMAMGEAAGAAAALSSRLGVTPRTLDIDLLQKRLVEQGARLFFDELEERRVAELREVPDVEERLAAQPAD